MDLLLKITITLAIVAHVIVAGVFSAAFLGQNNTRLINEAKFQCASTVRYTVDTEDATISYPPADLYQKCLADRGIK